VEFLAGRFAAKEAVLKCLGTGWARGMRWRDLEVDRSPAGAPTLSLAGAARRRAADLGIRTWHLSLTHTARTAAAVAIGQA
jgi:holo-[acyl-carrier protein] synthase